MDSSTGLLKDLIISTAGSSTWDKIRHRAEVVDLQFLDSSNYDDQLTYNLVTAASEILEQPVEDVLHAFGRHWVLYTGREGWASLFDFTGNDFIGFLGQLDEMHARVNSAMPDGRMPEFTLTELDQGYQLDYHSDREGLASMVMGILDGLAEQFDESWNILHTGSRDRLGFDQFNIQAITKEHDQSNREAA